MKLSNLRLLLFSLLFFLLFNGIPASSHSNTFLSPAGIKEIAHFGREAPQLLPFNSFLPAQRQELLNAIEWKNLSHKPYVSAAVFLTRYCNMSNCRFCLFNSPIAKSKAARDPMLHLTEERLEELILFLNDSNVDELIITGGGEPLLNDETLDMLCSLIKKTRIKKVGITTNGLWANNIQRAHAVLDTIREALGESNIKKFIFAFSVDEGHDPIALEGIVNIMGLYINQNGSLFDGIETEVNFNILKYTHDGLVKIVDLLKKQLEAHIGNGELDVDDFYEDLKSTQLTFAGIYGHFEYWLKKTRKRISFSYGINQLYARGRAQNLIDSFDTAPFSPFNANLFYGADSHDKFSTFVDTDGSICLESRINQNSLAFVSGHISEGFEIIAERERRDPLFRALREKGSLSVFKIIEKIDAATLNKIYADPDPIDALQSLIGALDDQTARSFDENKSDAPMYVLEDILTDEDLRIRVTCAILHEFFWNELTEESKKRFSRFEAESGINATTNHAVSPVTHDPTISGIPSSQ